MGSWGSIHFELCLTADLVYAGLVCELSNELVSLDVNILFAWGCFGRLHISCEKLFSSLGSLLLQTLGVILSLVSLEQLVGVCASWNDHGSISASAENTLIVCDILGEVFLGISSTIWILILLLLSYDSRMCSEPLSATCSATWLLQHFWIFI